MVMDCAGTHTACGFETDLDRNFVKPIDVMDIAQELIPLAVLKPSFGGGGGGAAGAGIAQELIPLAVLKLFP